MSNRFDSDFVHHEILFNRLNKFGINDKEHAWFQS